MDKRWYKFFGYIGLIILLVYILINTDKGERVDLREMRSAQQDLTTFAVGCVVRWDSSGQPYVLENSSHANTAGCYDLAIEPDGDFVVSHIGGDVSTIICEPDESLIRMNLECGGSGGGVKTTFRFQDVYNNQSVRGDDSRLRCTYCNVWLGWIKAV